ncbi:MAG TPA: MFS transporter [Thermoanaerobaculia bacterium]|nr:MFS transporter [Thermoanaerobaculia bacterium]
MSRSAAQAIASPFRAVGGAYGAAFSGLPRTVWLLATVTLVNRSGTMVLPFLTLYLTERRGFTPTGAGGVMALYGCGAIAGAYLGGWLCDRLEAKRVMGGSLVLGGLGFLALGALRAKPAVAVGVFALSLVGEAFRPAVSSAMVRAAPPAARTRAYAMLRLATNLGMMIGPVAAGFLAARSYLWLFLADGGTCLAAALLLWLSFRERGAAPAAAAERRPAAAASPWRDGPYLAVVGLAALLSIVFFQLMSTYPLTLRADYGLSEAYIGLSYGINTLIIVLVEMLLVHGLRDRPPLRVAGLGALLVGLGFGLLPWGSGYAFVAATVPVWTLGEMLSFPMLQGWVAARAAGRAEGRYLGLFTLAFAIAFMVAPLTGTWVYQHLGPRALWSAVAVAGVLLCAAFQLLDRALQSAGENRTTLLRRKRQ